MTRSVRLDRGREHAKLLHGLVISQGIGLHDFHRLQLLEPCLLCNLVLSRIGVILKMSDIGDVAHIADFVTQMLQQSEEHVVCDTRAGMPQMCISINRRSADIHSDTTGVYGFEKLFLARKCIEEVKIVSHSQSFSIIQR